jgi:uncharacterized protein (DUF2235 family)
MPKNIIICCDGTGNEYGRNNTNVVGLYERIIRDPAGMQQIGFYDPGVGTFNFFGAKVGNEIGVALGKAIGAGLQQNIEDAYAYLMDHFEDGDRIFLFGFSRGAYTARALAGMIHKCGLLQRGSRNLIPYASKIYNTPDNAKVAAGFKAAFSQPCKPYLIGVWDTVASLAGAEGGAFHDASLNEDISFGYHAMAIDETRKKFPVLPWDEARRHQHQTIEQVWFAGVHSDVGGWYDERGLSDIALIWMLEKAEAAGLALKDGWRDGLHPDHMGKKHESRTGFWKVWPKANRLIPAGASIHQSARDRIKDDPDYRPELP